jgi:hypothetical protein
MEGRVPAESAKRKSPAGFPAGLSFRSLAVTYSGMPEGHTTIGAERFHFRVRNGIGWFPLAMAARQTVLVWRSGVAPAASNHNLVRFSFKRLCRVHDDIETLVATSLRLLLQINSIA